MSRDLCPYDSMSLCLDECEHCPPVEVDNSPDASPDNGFGCSDTENCRRCSLQAACFGVT